MVKLDPHKARDVRDNYPLRIMVMLVVFCIHVAITWDGAVIPKWFWWVIVVHTLFLPHVAYKISSTRTHENINLLFDVFMYAVYIGTWGFNPFLAAVFMSTSNLTLISLNGKKQLLFVLACMTTGGLLGGLITGFYFRPELALAPMLITTTGFFVFMTGIAFLNFRTNSSLHVTRRELKSRHEELTDINNLASAVNSELDIDSIIRRLLAALEQHFALEAIYFLAHREKENKLCMAGIYGEAISYKEFSQFEHIEYDYDVDANSIFVLGLKQRRIINISNLTPEMVSAGSDIDRKLYNIKPSVSIAYFPVYIDDIVVGGLAFINHKKSFYLNKNDLKRIADYLIQVGNAIKNANLIKELTKAKEEAVLAKKKAEESEEAKSRFLANMSHEIRTPMSAILGYSEALQEPGISGADRRQFVDIIMSSGKHLLSMINDILDISKIEASKVRVEKINIDLSFLLLEMESYLKLKTEEKGLQYSVVINFPVPEKIVNDPTRLKQVLLNLCNNAIKFTDHGSVDLLVSWPQSSILTFSVKDSGIGMTPSECERVFEAFTQADSSTTRLYGGTGLGLTISKNLAILMGGNLDVRSEKGVGSQFNLSVDAGATSDVLISSSEAWAECKKRQNVKENILSTPLLAGKVLIAEDNIVNQQIILRLIEMTGVSADVVDDGKKAVDQVRAFNYDLILLDMQMPVMGGMDAAKAIQAMGVTTPLVAFTANVMTHQVDSYLDAGFIDVIEKPINRMKLYALLSNILPSRVSNLKKVLVVDDDEVNAMILSRQIKKFNEHLDVLVARDGQECLLKVECSQVDLIFMDMEMPVMGGLEATEKLRQSGYEKPIFIVTGNIDQEHKSLCLLAGATGHLAKPLDKLKMRSILEQY